MRPHEWGTLAVFGQDEENRQQQQQQQIPFGDDKQERQWQSGDNSRYLLGMMTKI
jgi:hypothetical protein